MLVYNNFSCIMSWNSFGHTSRKYMSCLENCINQKYLQVSIWLTSLWELFISLGRTPNVINKTGILRSLLRSTSAWFNLVSLKKIYSLSCPSFTWWYLSPPCFPDCLVAHQQVLYGKKSFNEIIPAEKIHYNKSCTYVGPSGPYGGSGSLGRARLVGPFWLAASGCAWPEKYQ